MSTVNHRYKFRRNTAAGAAASNPVLLAGEPGVELDTGKIKIGNGVTAWNDLPYAGAQTFEDLQEIPENVQNAASVLKRYAGGPALRSYTARDIFDDAEAAFVHDDTITSTISGTLKPYSDTANSRFRRFNRSFWIQNAGVLAGVKTGSTFEHTAGLTFVSYFTVPEGTTGSCRVGFAPSTIGAAVDAGVMIGALASNAKNSIGVLVGGANPARWLFQDVTRPREIYAVAVKLTATGWEAWIQGGYFERYGFRLRSGDWLKIYEHTGTLDGTLRGAHEARYGISKWAALHEVVLTSAFYPVEARGKMVELDHALTNTHMPAAVYDKDGNLWVAWWKGTLDSGPDGVVTVGCRRPDGRWLDSVVVFAASGATREDSGSLSLVNGAVWLTGNHTTDAWTTATPKRRILTIANDTIVVGAPAALTGIAAGRILSYNPIYRLSTGRVVIPLATTTHWWCGYSDDGGATWAEGTKYSPGNEPWFVEEPDGTLVAGVRVPSGTSASIPRYVSTDGGVTWTADGTFAGVPSNDSRAQGIRLPNGNVAIVGNDSAINFVRPNTTVWEIGEGGVVLNKTPITESAKTQNYPAAAAWQDRLALVIPFKGLVGSGTATVCPGYVLVVERPLAELSSVIARAVADPPSEPSPALVNPTVSGVIDMLAGTSDRKILLYKSGNTLYGMGVRVGGHQIFYTPPTAYMDFGEMSTADGLTFATQMRLWQSGGLGIGNTATDPGAGCLFVNRKIRLGTAAIINPAYAPTIQPTVDTFDVWNIQALTGNIEILNPTGSPTDGQEFLIRFLQNAAGGHAVTWGSNFAFGTDVTEAMIPTAANARWEMKFRWHAGTSKWRAVQIMRGF